MATTLEDIRGWFDRAERTATHMLVVCDTFDHEDYPVYIMPGDDLQERIQHYGTNMQRVMEVYNLSKKFPNGSGRVWDTDPVKRRK